MHPTTIKLATDHCPKAVEFYRDGAPYDRSIFEAGIAAHAVLQACGEATNQAGRTLRPNDYETIAESTAKALIAEGRSFDGNPEPPLNADRVWAGVRLALDYLREYPLPVGAHDEVPLAVGPDWKPARYKGGWLQHIADFVHLSEEVDEEDSRVVLISRDYKSAWPTDKSSVGDEETDPPLQTKVRALLTVAHFGEGKVARDMFGDPPEVLSLETVNLRTLATFKRQMWLRDDYVQETFKRWRKEIAATVEALSGELVASPGIGCYGCPFVTVCDAAKDFMGETVVGDIGLVLATSYSIAQSLRDETRKPVAEVTKDGEPIKVVGGTVGHYWTEQRRPTEEAYGQIADDWENMGGDLRGFAHAAGLGVRNLENVAKAMLIGEPPKKVREYVDTYTQLMRVKRFGIVKEKSCVS